MILTRILVPGLALLGIIFVFSALVGVPTGAFISAIVDTSAATPSPTSEIVIAVFDDEEFNRSILMRRLPIKLPGIPITVLAYASCEQGLADLEVYPQLTFDVVVMDHGLSIVETPTSTWGITCIKLIRVKLAERGKTAVFIGFSSSNSVQQEFLDQGASFVLKTTGATDVLAGTIKSLLGLP